jgi:hypothetical protein
LFYVSKFKDKLQEKQKIDEEIKQADIILQSKNVSIEAIDQYIQLKEELRKYRLSSKDIHRLLDLLLAAKEYTYSPRKIVAKLRNAKRLENKENKLLHCWFSEDAKSGTIAEPRFRALRSGHKLPSYPTFAFVIKSEWFI